MPENKSDDNLPKSLASSWKLLRKSWAFIRPVWGYLAYNVVLFAVWLATELAIPYFVGRAINEIEEAGKEGRDFDISAWVWAVAIATVVRIVFAYMRGSRLSILTQRILWLLRDRLYDCIQRQPFRFHDEAQAGSLITAMTQDLQRVRAVFDQVLFGMLDLVIYIASALLVTIRLQWDLGLMVLVAFAGTMWMIGHFSTRLRAMWKGSWDKYDDVTSALQENIAGAQVVRAFAREQSEIDRFGGRSKEFVGSFITTVQYWASKIPLVQMLFRLVTPLVLLWGGWRVMHQTMPMGSLATILMYLGNIGFRLRTIGDLLNGLQNGISGAERVFEILDKAPELENPKDPRPLPASTRGRIEFRNVGFAYAPESPVLSSLSLRIEPGEKVAIVGPTGAGKSTLASLIPRFYDATSGTVLLDGMDVRTVDLAELRRSVAIVFQESFLFSTTIHANISYGNPRASDDEVRQAASVAQAGEFIEGLADGFRTMVGERGMNLSGGQRQRLSIARALVGNPRVLILDDAMASVDPLTEREIGDAIDSAARGRTTLIIAHRLATVRRADRIIVLEKGTITATGTHDELLDHSRVYREMCELQFEG